MKKLLFACLIGLSMLGGCTQLGFSPTGTIPVDKSLSPQEQAVQTSINEANVLIISIAKTAQQDYEGGIINDAEKADVVSTLKQVREGTKSAQALLNGKNVLDAKNKIALEKAIILQLQQKLAAKAHGG